MTPRALERDAASLRMVDAVDDIEHRGFARAVRADDGEDLVLPDVEGNRLQGDHSAEGERDLIDLENGAAEFSTGAHGRSRAGQAARLAAATVQVRASRIFRSAQTVPVRPSSNRTCVST